MKHKFLFHSLAFLTLGYFIAGDFSALNADHGNFKVTPSVKNNTDHPIELHYDLVYYQYNHDNSSCERYSIQGPDKSKNVILNPGQTIKGETEEFVSSCDSVRIEFYVCLPGDEKCFFTSKSKAGSGDLKWRINNWTYGISECADPSVRLVHPYCAGPWQK